MDRAPLPALPCYPCPHQSACCAFGTSLSDEEASAIRARYGSGGIYQTRWGEWRTRVVKGRCAFFANNACRLYQQPFYPEVCRGFPWVNAEGEGPYEYDRTICPEFTLRPELLQIEPFVRRSAQTV